MFRRSFVLAPSLLALLGACSQPLTQAPEQGALTPLFGTAGFDSASDVASLSCGSVYVSGGFSGDAFTRRYAPHGELLAEAKSGTPEFDITRSVAVGSDGFVYRATQFEGSGTGTDTEVRKSASSLHYFEWTRSVASSGSDVAYGVAVDSSHNVYVAGYTTGALGGSNKGSLDAFVRKYSASGAVLWTRQFGTSGVDTANGVAVSSSGYIYVVSYTGGALAGSNQGGRDAFVRKYSPGGVVQWTRQFQLGGDDEAYDVAVRGTGEVYVVGTYDYSVSDQDGFIRKYDGLGNVRWTNTFGGPQGELMDGVSVDNLGNVYVAGATGSSLHGVSGGGFDALVRKYSPNGALAWGKQFGTAGSDYAEAVASCPDGREVFVVGRTSGPLAGSSGGTDAFFRKLGSDGETAWTK